MKNKKTFVGLFVILALLCLGIGYAAVSKNLVISGTGTTNNETGDASDDVLAKNFLVKFADSYTTNVTNGDGAKINVSIDSDTEATINAYELTTLNKSVSATLTIVNDSEDLIATIDIPTIENASEYFKVETDWTKTVLNPDGSKEVTVTITLIKSPIEHQDATFKITFVAEASETE